MSDERFNQIDERFNLIDERFNLIDDKITELDHRFERRFKAIDVRFDAMDQRFDAMDQRFAHIDSKFEELGRHMRVLHEEVIDRIASTRESPTTTSVKPHDVRDEISRRLDPLEALMPVVREHGVTLRKHDAEIERLKRRRR
jgi:chromosome segregation ATPase